MAVSNPSRLVGRHQGQNPSRRHPRLYPALFQPLRMPVGIGAQRGDVAVTPDCQRTIELKHKLGITTAITRHFPPPSESRANR